MNEKTVALNDATRALDDWVDRANSEGTTLVFTKNGHPVARLVPEAHRCTGRELAAVVSRTSLSAAEASAWQDDLRTGREALRPPRDPWQ